MHFTRRMDYTVLGRDVPHEEGNVCIVCLAYLKTHIPGEQPAPKCIQFLFVDKILLLQSPHHLADHISIFPSGTNSPKFLEILLQVTFMSGKLTVVMTRRQVWYHDIIEDFKSIQKYNI